MTIVEECHLPNLHYLDAVLKETLRLHPPLSPLLPKRLSQSAIVGGYTIPGGTKVFLNVYAIHRHPQVWESPLEFQPERFLSCSTKLDYAGNDMKHLPFGSGRRICAGLSLAEKMVMFILASLLDSFDWKLPEGKNVDLSEVLNRGDAAEKLEISKVLCSPSRCLKGLMPCEQKNKRPYSTKRDVEMKLSRHELYTLVWTEKGSAATTPTNMTIIFIPKAMLD